MSLDVVGFMGALIGIEFSLRIIDYLYTRKNCSLGNVKKNKLRNKTNKTNRKKTKET